MKENALKKELKKEMEKELDWPMIRDGYKDLVESMKPRYGRLWAEFAYAVAAMGILMLPEAQLLFTSIPACHVARAGMIVICLYYAFRPFFRYLNFTSDMVDMAEKGLIEDMNEDFRNADFWDDNLRFGEKFLIISKARTMIAYENIFSVGLRHSASRRVNGWLSIGYVKDDFQDTADIPLDGRNDEELMRQARELAGMLQEKNPVIHQEFDMNFMDAAAESLDGGSRWPSYRA